MLRVALAEQEAMIGRAVLRVALAEQGEAEQICVLAHGQ
jgi:hypothetical protein